MECKAPDFINADFCIIVPDDSMINARLFVGDIVYIRQQQEVENGEITAVLIDGEAVLRRVWMFEDHVVLEPANPLYRSLVLWDGEVNNIHIIGKAVAFTGMIGTQ